MIVRGLLVAVLALTQTAAVNESRLLFGRAGCLVADGQRTLERGERLMILARGKEPSAATVSRVSELSQSPECGKTLRDLQNQKAVQIPVERAATISIPASLLMEPIFAAPQSSGLLVRGGPRLALDEAAARRWRNLVEASLDPDWRGANSLARAYGYGRDGAAVELYIGRPVPPVAPSGAIHSIEIRRFFIIDGKVLASERLDRSTGREERVDMTPPTLTRDNWTDDSPEGTVAFVSEDRGKSWQRLSTNVGFEGTWWIVQSLVPGLPKTLERYNYTGG